MYVSKTQKVDLNTNMIVYFYEKILTFSFFNLKEQKI